MSHLPQYLPLTHKVLLAWAGIANRLAIVEPIIQIYSSRPTSYSELLAGVFEGLKERVRCLSLEEQENRRVRRSLCFKKISKQAVYI